MQGNVQSSRCEKCSGEWPVNTRSHQPPTPKNQLSCRTSWTLAWEVSFLHPSQLLCQPQGRAHRLPGRECLPPAHPCPADSRSQAGFLKRASPAVCRSVPVDSRRLTLTPPGTPVSLQPDLFSRRCRVGPSCFLCADLPPPPRGEQHLLLSPSQKWSLPQAFLSSPLSQPQSSSLFLARVTPCFGRDPSVSGAVCVPLCPLWFAC